MTPLVEYKTLVATHQHRCTKMVWVSITWLNYTISSYMVPGLVQAGDTQDAKILYAPDGVTMTQHANSPSVQILTCEHEDKQL